MEELPFKIIGGHVCDERYCHRCKEKTLVYLVRSIAANGSINIYWECQKHKGGVSKSAQFISHKKIIDAGYDINELPVVSDYRGHEKCVVCGKPNIELHHFAPRHLFGDDCEKWPKAYLCKECHALWHRLVTPDMCRRNNEDVQARSVKISSKV